jgi:hypothetical protein
MHCFHCPSTQHASATGGHQKENEIDLTGFKSAIRPTDFHPLLCWVCLGVPRCRRKHTPGRLLSG